MEKKIMGYVDGRLKEGERLEMEKHLSTCVVCQLRVNEFRAVHVLLDELPMIEPSAAFDVRTQARVAAEPAKQNWWAWFASSPRVAFAALAAPGASSHSADTEAPFNVARDAASVATQVRRPDASNLGWNSSPSSRSWECVDVDTGSLGNFTRGYRFGPRTMDRKRACSAGLSRNMPV